MSNNNQSNTNQSNNNHTPRVSNAASQIAENSPDGSAVGTVLATTPGETLAYAITAGNRDLDGDSKPTFAIDPATGKITVNDRGELDFETTPSFNLTVTATDAGGLSDTAAIKIKLADVIEITPGTVYYDPFTINAPTETIGANLNGKAVEISNVGATNWTSADLYLGGTNTFAESQGNGYIVPNTPHTSSLASLPYTLETGVYKISADLFPEKNPNGWGYLGIGFFMKNSGGYIWQAGTTSLMLNLLSSGEWGLTGAVNGPDAVLEGVLSAGSYDATKPVHVILTWDTIHNTVSGSIDGIVLFVDHSLSDTKITPSQVHYVGIARDGALGPGSLIDNFQLTANSYQNTFTFAVAENSAKGTAVGAIEKTGLVDPIFSITEGNADPDGNGQPAFAIDSATGQLTVNDSGDLDFETTPGFTLTIQAEATDGKSLTSTAQIDLTNVDEPGNEAPIGQDATFTLPENSANGTEVGAVIATDIDAGDTLSYAITAGNSDPDKNGNPAFAIDPATGKITVNDNGDLDFETSPAFNLTVNVTDAGGLSDTAAITINLTDVFELIGSPGNDKLKGTDGNDVINGLAGDDTLSGGGGDDELIGGEGMDRIKETGDVDFTLTENRLTGLGTDRFSNMEQAYLIGGFSDNRLDASGFTGRKTILEGNQGNDALLGGLANDWVKASGNVDFTLSDSRLTGLGTDTLVKMDNALLIGGDGDNRIDAANFTGRQVILDGGAGDDTLIGRSEGIDWVSAHSDQDFTLTDTQLTGLGTDTLIDIDQAKLIGDSGNNTLDASAFTKGRVFLNGENGNDTLKGGNGDDILVGGLGDDRLIGGAGTDRVAAEGDLDFTLTDTQLTGLGTDSLNSIEEAYLAGGLGNNILDASAFTGDRVILEGEAGDDRLIGRSTGIDRVRAQGDVDFTLTDTQLTGLGTDALVDIDQAQLLGNSGDNLFDASLFTRGSVSLSGGGGMDTLLGGGADDTLAGGHGDDIINGGLGRDILIGGAGADLFRFTSASEISVSLGHRDVIKDFDLKQNDKIDLSAIDANLTLEGQQVFAPLTEGKHFSGRFNNPAELYFDQTAHILYGNNDADNKADFALKLVGVDSLLDAFA